MSWNQTDGVNEMRGKGDGMRRVLKVLNEPHVTPLMNCLSIRRWRYRLPTANRLDPFGIRTCADKTLRNLSPLTAQRSPRFFTSKPGLASKRLTLKFNADKPFVVVSSARFSRRNLWKFAKISQQLSDTLNCKFVFVTSFFFAVSK